MAIYMWRATPPWIYHNSTLWLITLADGAWNDITIADKNLWATQVYNDGDALSKANCGKYYQWWNNYWFPRNWWMSTAAGQVSSSGYWPWNYYSSSIFRIIDIGQFQNWDWSSNQNDNLRWDVTDTSAARRWPCDSWYHIPSASEASSLLSMWANLFPWNISSFYSTIKMPGAWRIIWNNWNVLHSGWLYWTTAPSVYPYNTRYSKLIAVGVDYLYNGARSDWLSIRPFKNTPVQPDETRTVLYQ